MRAGDSAAIATTILWVSQSIHTHTHMRIITHYIVATIAAESPAHIIAAVLYPHYITSQHITQNNQT